MNSYILSIIISAGIAAIAAVSLSLVVNFAGRIALSHGVMIGLGAYSYALMIERLEFPALIALILAPLSAMFVAGALALLAGRMEVHVFLIATLALQFVGHEVFKRWDSVTNGDAGLTGIPRPLGLDDVGLAVLAVILTVVVVSLLYPQLKGQWGLRLRAIREDADAASASGVDVQRSLLVAFVISGGVAGLAGALHAAQVSFIVPDSFGLHWSLLLVVMCMVGGANVIGVACSAVALVLLPEVAYSVFDLPSQLTGPVQDVLYGCILVLVMVFRPSGMVNESHVKPTKAAIGEHKSFANATRG